MSRIQTVPTQTALDEAMYLFWQQGYEHTSMQQLVERMQINRQNLYKNYGDKHTLFIKALNRYIEIVNQKLLTMTATGSVEQRLIRIFDYLKSEISSYQIRGCLIVNSATEFGDRDSEVNQLVAQFTETNRIEIYKMLAQAQATGEVAKDKDIEQLANLINVNLIGFRVLVKVTSDQTVLQSVIEATIKLLK